MKATFENTVDILVKAYLNDELSHNDCCACAVGNIVRAAGFKRYAHWNFSVNPDSCGSWKALFMTTCDTKEQIKPFKVRPEDYAAYTDRALRMVEATGYTVDELSRIEFTFEIAPNGKNKDERMLNGLMAVVDVLAEIHNVDLSVKENAKLLFVKL